jgi:hypothetical protein
MKTCLFVGPTLHGEATPSRIKRFGPAAMGSVFRALEAGYRRIGIIDGHFGNVPSVWHKEILFALSEGAEVTGAASMGALRAAELHPFGMIGIGRAYRLFRRALLTDDDELAVIHAPEALAFCPLSEAMVNVRFTLRKLRRLDVISTTVEQALVLHMKSLHFSARTREELERHASDLVGDGHAERIADRYGREYVDVKRVDARALVRWMMRGRSGPRPVRLWRFPATGHWHKQFEHDIADVPLLQ